ncbi:ATP-dependent DNA helicase [Trichonephila clavipes]|nr:ATP-dependent DNA helicase [Trichonephila clavipes]
MLVVTKQRSEYWICSLHERHPTVIPLAVNLPNGERIFFTENNFRERMSTPSKKALNAFILLCQNDAFIKTLLYVDVQRYYTWNVSLKVSNSRVQGTPVDRRQKTGDWKQETGDKRQETRDRETRDKNRRCSWTHLHSPRK